MSLMLVNQPIKTIKERGKQMELNLEQKQFIKTGIIKTVGATEFAVLLVIQAHTDIQQESAFPSQQTIADLTGLSTRTVQRAVKSLEDKGLIQREQTGYKGLTIYSIKTVGQETTEQEELIGFVEPVRKYKTSKDFINQFCKLYFDHYHVNYSPNWARDGALIKNKLLNNYTDEQLDYLLEFTFKNFDKRYANRQYPRPTFGAMASFIVNDAMAEQQKEQKKEQELEQFEEFDFEKYFRNQPDWE